MQVARFSSLSLSGVRFLYSAVSLGIDTFTSNKHRIKNQFQDVEKKFKEKMNQFVNPDESTMIFTEDLKHMIHLTDESPDDLELVKKMMMKFCRQNKDYRFGSFVFGPVVMRMYYVLDKPKEALDAFYDLHSDGFFDQLISYQILMDLLLKNNMFQEVIDIFNIVKDKQIKGARFPKNAVVLVLAACYKMNTPEAFEFTKKLWSELNQFGHYPMRRAATFAAALAVSQGAPDIALEILTTVKQQGYVTIRNLKIEALSELGRPDDALPLLRAILDSDRPTEKGTICEEIVDKLSKAIDNFGRKEISEEFDRVKSQLSSLGRISSVPLSELLCAEIKEFTVDENRKIQENKWFNRPRSNYSLRPGLKDML